MVTIPELRQVPVVAASCLRIPGGLDPAHGASKYLPQGHPAAQGRGAILDKLPAAWRLAQVSTASHLLRRPQGARQGRDEGEIRKGPIGVVTVWPAGRRRTGHHLGLWFRHYIVVLSIFVAYLASRTLPMERGGHLEVFRFAGTLAFVAYAGSDSVVTLDLEGPAWSATLRKFSTACSIRWSPPAPSAGCGRMPPEDLGRAPAAPRARRGRTWAVLEVVVDQAHRLHEGAGGGRARRR